MLGTSIVQPGPEVAPTRPADTFAALSAFIPIEFPQTKLSPAVNRFDAAIAVVTNTAAIKSREILGIAGYDPVLKAPIPGMNRCRTCGRVFS